MITHGTVTVTVTASESQGSVYSSSASSSTVDGDDTYTRNDDDSANLSDEMDFVAAFASPVAIADDEHRLSDGGGWDRDKEKLGYTDAFEEILPHRAGTAVRQQRLAAAAASAASAAVRNAARMESRQGEKRTPSGSTVEAASVGGEGRGGATPAQASRPQNEFQERNGRRRWSGIDSLPTEKVLTRLYEGNCFGEMALIYDEPRNASVRALTKVTCVYLHKDDFRRCLCDKTFNNLMQQAALQTACYREQKAAVISRQQGQQGQQQHSARIGTEPARNFVSVRALAAVRGATRSSFRATEQLTFAGDAKGETNGRVINDYRVCKKVGEGSFGAVYKVVHVHSGEPYAMKVCAQQPSSAKSLHAWECCSSLVFRSV